MKITGVLYRTYYVLPIQKVGLGLSCHINIYSHRKLDTVLLRGLNYDHKCKDRLKKTKQPESNNVYNTGSGEILNYNDCYKLLTTDESLVSSIYTIPNTYNIVSCPVNMCSE